MKGEWGEFRIFRAAAAMEADHFGRKRRRARPSTLRCEELICSISTEKQRLSLAQPVG
jgi:hypothetical protein